MDLTAIIFISANLWMVDVGMQVKHEEYLTVIMYSMFFSKTCCVGVV